MTRIVLPVSAFVTPKLAGEDPFPNQSVPNARPGVVIFGARWSFWSKGFPASFARPELFANLGKNSILRVRIAMLLECRDRSPLEPPCLSL
jgi:hypothetical protein